MRGPVLLAIDQGTTGTTLALFDSSGNLVQRAYEEHPQSFPRQGWVEHDPSFILQSVGRLTQRILSMAEVAPTDVAAIGITNQRETVVMWERTTGRPIHPAIVWQCRRTASLCERLQEEGWADRVKAKTGLVIDPYFSATKIAWLLDEVPGAREKAERGELLCGTIDSWLLWNLTDAKESHVTDYSNASRTMLFDIHKLAWDDDLCQRLRIPKRCLPRVLPSVGLFGRTSGEHGMPAGIPITGVAGDQQAALFGQTCFSPGQAKSTYGTGTFLLLHTGTTAPPSEKGLLTTIAWGLEDRVEYAVEGSVFVSGAAIQWLRDALGLIPAASATEALARSVPDSGGVIFVPALAGLGAPFWDPQARGLLIGLSRGTTRAHIVRAALEAIALRTRDVLEAMLSEAGLALDRLRVDGGAAANDFLLQYQADLLGIPVERPHILETTALGAAYLAGLGAGVWPDQAALQAAREHEVFEPTWSAAQRTAAYTRWLQAVERAKGWEA